MVPFLLCRLPSLRYFVTRGNTTHMSSVSFPFHIVYDGLWERVLTAQPEQLVHAMRAAGLDGYPRDNLEDVLETARASTTAGHYVLTVGGVPRTDPISMGIVTCIATAG